MNREEILAKSRSQKSELDEREQHIHLKACHISRAVGFVLCQLVYLLEMILSDNHPIVGPTAYIIYMGMAAVEGWIMIFKVHKKVYLVQALVTTLCFVLFVFFFIQELR